MTDKTTVGPCGRAGCDGHVMGCSRADCPNKLENQGYVCEGVINGVLTYRLRDGAHVTSVHINEAGGSGGAGNAAVPPLGKS